MSFLVDFSISFVDVFSAVSCDFGVFARRGGLTCPSTPPPSWPIGLALVVLFNDDGLFPCVFYNFVF